MTQFFDYYIGSIVILSVIFQLDKNLLQFNKSFFNKRVIFIILIFSIFISLINMRELFLIQDMMRLLIVYVLLFYFCKVIFKRDIYESIIVSLIVYLGYVSSEVIIAILISMILKGNSIAFMQNTIIVNVSISGLVYLIINMFKGKLIDLINNNKVINKGSYIILLIILFTLTLLLIKLPINKWELNIEFIFTMLLVLSFCLIGILIFRQNAEIQETKSKYLKLVDYSNIINNVLENYRILAHEHKNQMLIIKSMIEENSDDLLSYIDNLLEKKMDNKYPWIEELNYLPLSGLKGLINYKLMEMQSEHLNVTISVSKDIIKSKMKKLNIKQKDELYSIMGVYLDNAMQAAINSDKKEVSLEIYKQKNKIIFILANTFEDNIDLDKIDEYGYTCKGKNHGVGLHIVKKIMEEDKLFSQTRRILAGYYVQELEIHLKGVK